MDSGLAAARRPGMTQPGAPQFCATSAQRCRAMGYPGIYTIRGVMGVCHLLVDAERKAVLLDTGLVGEAWLIRWRLSRLGLKPESIKAILLTHGHLDHAGNLTRAKTGGGAAMY